MKFKPRILETRWDPKIEKGIFDSWEKGKITSFNLNTKKKIFTIDTPPPYPSGKPWHIGAAVHYSQIDMIARTARMLGFEVKFPIGIDRNGLPVEIYTENEFNIETHKTPREKFIKLCAHALDDVEAEMLEIMKSMGMSCNFDNYYRTDSEDYRILTQATFIELWNKGLIYESTRPNIYCIHCKTTIADAEVEYKELITQLVYINFDLKDGRQITIATTRPELLCACQAIIFHPDDDRYKNLEETTAILPIYNREVSIIQSKEAKPEFGTGLAMICSYGDFSDVRLFRELGLQEIIAINEEGKMTENAGKYSFQLVEDARIQIIKDLKEQGAVVKTEEIKHRTPVCGRSRTPIEIISMKEYYLKQIEYLPNIRKIAENMLFHPEKHRQILLNWIDSVTIDWPISRRRYYGTEIPIWYCKECDKPNIPKSGKYYQPWKEKPPFKSCQHCGSKKGFIGENRIFDTWMDSSVSPLFISGYLRDNKHFKKTFPNTLRPQAKDIVRTWLFYTILRCFQLTNQPPFDRVWIMGFGVDEKGERMSKSRGNVIDPFPILKKYGADTFRFWGASETSLGSDFRCSVQKIASASRFLTKIWNISRFISSFPKPKEVKLTNTDKWILAELSNLIKISLKGYKSFNFFIPSNTIREFAWNLFAAHYIEIVKKRAYGQGFTKDEQKAAWFTLHTCLKNILLLLAPITPFITEVIWKQLYHEKSIHVNQFPEIKWKTDLSEMTSDLIRFNSKIWNDKKEKDLSLTESIKTKIPEKLKPFEKDLIHMHNITT